MNKTDYMIVFWVLLLKYIMICKYTWMTIHFFDFLISLDSEFHTFWPLKEKLGLYNSVFDFGTIKLSENESRVLYDCLLFVVTIRFDKYWGTNPLFYSYINKDLWYNILLHVFTGIIPDSLKSSTDGFWKSCSFKIILASLFCNLSKLSIKNVLQLPHIEQQ